MLFDPSVDTIDEVLEIRQAAKDAAKNGLTVMSWSSGDSSATLTRDISVQEVLTETLAFLRKADPETYGVHVKKARFVFIN